MACPKSFASASTTRDEARGERRQTAMRKLDAQVVSAAVDRAMIRQARNPAADMMHNWLVKAVIMLGLGLNLASCGGFVADHWPHWAGAPPDGVPPRPGASGYAEYIAHGQATPEAVDAASRQQPAETSAVNGGH